MIRSPQRNFFTLLELLSVIGIIAIVAGIILGGMNYASRRADEAKTLSIMESFSVALEAFRDDRGYYPIVKVADEVKFVAGGAWDLFLEGHSKTERPYMEGIQGITELKDAYGFTLRYECPGTNNPQKFDLWSVGPDGVLDTDDDICNWKRN